MRKIDFFYKNFDIHSFCKNLKKRTKNNQCEEGGDFLSDIVIESVRDISQIKKEINSDFIYRYPGNKFFTVGVGLGKDFFLIKKIDQYEDIGLMIKTNDKKYIIYGIQGRIFCISDINDCFSKQETISSDLKEFFEDNAIFEVWEGPHRADKTNQSHVYGNRFDFENSGDVISVNVYDWSKKFSEEKKWHDHVSVSIHSKVFYDFLSGTVNY